MQPGSIHSASTSIPVSVSMDRATRNVQAYVLDAVGEPVPIDAG